MVREELYIHACRYAIGELARKGSTGFITSSDEGGQLITWVEVMEWLNREQQSEDAINKDLAEYEKDLNELKEQILKEGNTLLTKRDLLERFCKIDEEYNGRSWKLLQILANINILIGQESCEDCVSRQAVLDKKELVELEDGQSFYCISPEDVETLPSVTSKPKYNTSEWCKTCSEYDQDKHCCPRYNGVIRKAVEEIKKPKVGHWIFDEILDRNYYCSECKSMGVDYWDYCPYCGCRMVKPQESEG